MNKSRRFLLGFGAILRLLVVSPSMLAGMLVGLIAYFISPNSDTRSTYIS
jgi:hypothetical protein